jgi:formylglycine-generating enzyme required for sulfatase activity
MTGKEYRLLSEAEWEYAARAGSQERWLSGDEAFQLGRGNYAWFSLNSKGMTWPVGTMKPNAFGLYDMHGNVWQWVEDCWHFGYQNAPTNGIAWTADCKGQDRRVLRRRLLGQRSRPTPLGQPSRARLWHPGQRCRLPCREDTYPKAL